MHESLGKVPPQLSLGRVVLLAEQVSRAPCGTMALVPSQRLWLPALWWRLSATMNPQSKKAPSASPSGRSSWRNR